VLEMGIIEHAERKRTAATQKVLQRPDVREKFAGVGAVTTGGTPDEFATYIAADLARWTKVVKDANVKVD